MRHKKCLHLLCRVHSTGDALLPLPQLRMEVVATKRAAFYGNKATCSVLGAAKVKLAAGTLVRRLAQLGGLSCTICSIWRQRGHRKSDCFQFSCHTSGLIS